MVASLSIPPRESVQREYNLLKAAGLLNSITCFVKGCFYFNDFKLLCVSMECGRKISWCCNNCRNTLKLSRDQCQLHNVFKVAVIRRTQISR